MVLKVPQKRIVNDIKELEVFAQELTRYLKKQSQPFFLLLSGDLGAGKTTLTKFIIHHLGIKALVSSPTFIILNQYETKNHQNINHMDAYRLTKAEDSSAYLEIFENSLNIIEWPEKLNVIWEKYPHIRLKISIINNRKRLLEVE